MAQLQYIGARYVPKFYDNPDTGDMTWKSGVPYEPLTVVTFGGNSYTSKIPVAGTVGDPASNPAYWAKTGDYNAAIEGLQEEISELQQPITIDRLADPLANTVSNGLDWSTRTLFRKYDYITTLTNDAVIKSMQGGCYNSRRDSIVLGFDSVNDDDGMLVELSTDFTTVIQRKTMGADYLGHCNDMTYNPNTNKIYVCTARGSAPAPNQLAIINANTLEFEGYQTLAAPPSNTNAWEIAYDVENDLYVALHSDYIQVFDADFNLVSENALTTPYWSNANYVSGHSKQCSEIRNGHLYVATYCRNGYAANVDCCTVIIMDYEGNTISSFIVDGMVHEEVEAIINIDGILYFTFYGYSGNYIVKACSPQTKANIVTGTSLYNAGMAIGADTDLNNLKTAGKYYVPSAAIANTLINAYVKLACAIHVIDNGNNSVVQEMSYCSSGHTYIGRREYRPSSDAWTDWAELGDTYAANTKTFDFAVMVCPGFISNSGKDVRMFIPMPKDISNHSGNNFTIDDASAYISVRKNGKMLTDGNSTQIPLSDKTISYFPQPGGLFIRIRKSDSSIWTWDDNTNVDSEDTINLLAGNLKIKYTV